MRGLHSWSPLWEKATMVPATDKKFQLSFLKLFENVALLIPLFIIVFLVCNYQYHVLSSGVLNDNLFRSSNLANWKALRNASYILYLGMGAVSVFLFESIQSMDGKRRDKFIVKMVGGFFLVLFSYAIAGLLIDLCWVGYYFYLSASGQSKLLTR